MIGAADITSILLRKYSKEKNQCQQNTDNIILTMAVFSTSHKKFMVHYIIQFIIYSIINTPEQFLLSMTMLQQLIKVCIQTSSYLKNPKAPISKSPQGCYADSTGE